MATEVKLPRLGQGMESGVIVRWLKAEGDTVSQGDPLYELDTDKVTQEVEAEVSGVLSKIVVPEGEVEVGTTVAIETNGDAPAPPAASRGGVERRSAEPSRRLHAEAESDAAGPSNGGDRARETPAVNRAGGVQCDERPSGRPKRGRPRSRRRPSLAG